MTKNYPKINPRHLCLPFRSFSEGGLPRYLVTLLLILLTTHTSNLPLGASAKWGLTTQIHATNYYYIAPDACEPYHTNCNPGLGDDVNPGTISQPFKTFDKAWSLTQPGDTMYLLNGVYYQTLQPKYRNGRPSDDPNDPEKLHIKVKALNDGQVVIDGQWIRIPIRIGECWAGSCPTDPGQSPVGNYFLVEGVVAKNSSFSAIQIRGSNNIVKRTSAYNANTDTNDHAITIGGNYNLLEDCIAAGSGRKMMMIYQSDNNTIRRCYAHWVEWQGLDFCTGSWPNGQNIQVYHGRNNIIENSIATGPIPNSSISVQANSPNAVATNNKVLGSIAMYAGMNLDGSVKEWGDIPNPNCGPWNPAWPGQRSGFSMHGSGEIKDNLLQDIFAFSNAGLGLVESMTGQYSNNTIHRATLINNGLDNPDGPWPGQYGGTDTDVLQNSLDKFGTVSDSRIDKIFINWPGYPSAERNMTSMNGTGARLNYRYIDGNLTNQPLWPWPMEDRIRHEFNVHLSMYHAQTPELQNFSVTNTIVPILAEYGAIDELPPTPTPHPADRNGDGVVNIFDLNQVIANFTGLTLSVYQTVIQYFGKIL